jgi:hypothetical protein
MKDLFILSKSQQILFFSAMAAIMVQILCVYSLQDETSKECFKLDKCIGYLIFSALSYLFYYQMAIK